MPRMTFHLPVHPRRPTLGGLALALGLFLGPLPRAASAAPGDSPLDADLVFKADSLKRVIERRVYSDADKKEIRACDRDKAEFLRQARAADPEYARTDKALNEAKLAGASPEDPAVHALLQKKFAFEKAFDDRYQATPKAKQCAEGEARRRKALAAALEKDKAYQALLRRIAASSPDHL